MLSGRIGPLLRTARAQLGVGRTVLAQRVGVSPRLLAELERGQRPNVSLETTLRILGAVGVSVQLSAPQGDIVLIRSAAAETLARAARAAQRRKTWTGRRVQLCEEGEDPGAGRSAEQRVAAVSGVTRQSFGLATAARAAGAKRPVKSGAKRGVNQRKRSGARSSSPGAGGSSTSTGVRSTTRSMR